MSIVTKFSPNFTAGRKNYTPFAIVIHIMDGTLTGTDSWFSNPASKVSAHYGVGQQGEVHQYVKETDSAWHAGRVYTPSWSLIKTSNGQYINPNYYTIGIEHEGKGDTPWSDAMYAASAALIRDIADRWHIPLDRQHVIGHHEIYGAKTCPGTKVDLNKLIALANGNHTTPVNNDDDGDIPQKVKVTGKVTSRSRLNIRSAPDTHKAPVNIVEPGIQLAYDGYVNNGEKINNNSKWYYTEEGSWFWSGGVK
ncbi:N-acetylmuramoyl-L-alanine amidase [Chitinophaga silvisoli]|uniref:N-acetylmuramoyl-L-alanine amidase n=1 Tax=Chitinophaga silvisoli TaxID=2291814 RepID=A0A3E1P8S2_9BACT|nr:peptidoglycan recognition family protein [Chitinophaga silvisoli]RFM36428.1 N-acetylmuramoyl-L-alanine amidase [Chitinophaga silvisoli]